MIKQSYRNNNLRFNHKISYNPVSVKADSHIYWELILIKQGRGVYTVNGKEYSIAENFLIITRPMDPHAITLAGDEPYERYNIAFEGSQFYEAVLADLPAEVDVINCSRNERVRDLFQKISYYLEQRDLGNLKDGNIETLIHQTIYEILCNLHILYRQKNTSRPDTRSPLVSRAVEFINDNITRQVTAGDLADYLSVSRRYLEKLFAEHLHVTPKQYIITRKLSLARQDLRAGSTPSEVCGKYGFSDYSGFYRQYLKYFGYKPSETARIDSPFGIDM